MSKKKVKNSKLPAELQKINLNAAGIDIGAEFHFVCVPEGRGETTVREFSSFTNDLYRLADWLLDCGITTVAMESTGVYWVPLYEILEERGLEIRLVNARHVKNVPGRKSDVLDCQWLQRLHMYGLLEGSFRPNQESCVLRAYMRQRDMLVKCSATHIQHMQKALMQMNIQLHHVIATITGVTGMRIIRAIVAGERSAKTLAALRHECCKNSEEVIEQALVGNYREEHVFALRQALELYDIYQSKLIECDREVEGLLEKFDCKTNEEVPLSKKKKKRRDNELYFDVRKYLYQITGVDLTLIDGIEGFSVLKIISEIGLDMSRWKSPKQFGSWLGLAPGTKISGGKKLSSKTKPCANRAAAVFRMSANTLYRSNSALGAFFRRQKARLGAPKAITATAHKLARLFYTMLKYGIDYNDAGANYYEEQFHNRLVSNMQKKARSLGYELVKTPSGIS
jgi:transposase